MGSTGAITIARVGRLELLIESVLQQQSIAKAAKLGALSSFGFVDRTVHADHLTCLDHDVIWMGKRIRQGRPALLCPLDLGPLLVAVSAPERMALRQLPRDLAMGPLNPEERISLRQRIAFGSARHLRTDDRLEHRNQSAGAVLPDRDRGHRGPHRRGMKRLLAHGRHWFCDALWPTLGITTLAWLESAPVCGLSSTDTEQLALEVLQVSRRELAGTIILGHASALPSRCQGRGDTATLLRDILKALVAAGERRVLAGEPLPARDDGVAIGRVVFEQARLPTTGLGRD